MSAPPQPNHRESIADKDGKPTTAYIKFFAKFTSALQGQLDGLAAAVASILALEGTTGNLAATKADKATTITGAGSVIGGGDLSSDKTLSLLNDDETPGASMVYGTDGAGLKGWQAAASTAGLVIDSIADADTTHAPSRNAVFDALALKQDIDAQLTSLGALTYGSNALKVIRVNAGETDFELATVSGGSLADGDYGDVTVSSSGTVFTIDAGAVTYAKMQDVSATARVLGRKTSGSGDVEECTLSELLDFIGSAAQGDILYRGASTWARLAAGTSGHFLKTLGAGADPAWAAASGGSGAMTLVGTATVSGSAATTLAISGLDLATDGMYMIRVSLKNATASLAIISGYYNADTTATNYDQQNLSVAATVVSASRANNAVCGIQDASATTTADFVIFNDDNAKPALMWRQRSGATTTINLRSGATLWRTAANVTGFTLSSDIANSLAIGSSFKVWKIN